MNGHDDEDPTAPPAPFRFLSGSPENVLRRCPFAAADDSDSDSSESDSDRVESTGIFMMSLPDTLESSDHSHQTAPEELAPTGFDGRPSVAAMDSIGEDGKVVDLGRDTDVGLLSEVQSTVGTGEKGESVEVIHGSESKQSGLRFDESVVSLGESSSKRLRLSDEALGLSSCAGAVLDGFPADSTNSGGGSKILPVSPVGHNNGNEIPGENVEEKSVGKEMKNSGMDDGKVSNGEMNEGVNEGVKNSQSHEQSKLQEEIANGDQLSSPVPPPSIGVVKENAAGKKSNTSEVHHSLITVLNTLKGFKEEDTSGYERLSIMDFCKSRGMTFPRPTWWPPEF